MRRTPSAASLVQLATVVILGFVTIHSQPLHFSELGAIGQLKQCARYIDCCSELRGYADHAVFGDRFGRIAKEMAQRAILLCCGVIVAALTAGGIGLVPRWLSVTVAVLGALGLVPHLRYLGYF